MSDENIYKTKEYNIDLIKYHISCAWEAMESDEKNLEIGEYKTANNRAYYAVFYALSACIALKNLAYKHHSQVIGAFNKNIKRGTWALGDK